MLSLLRKEILMLFNNLGFYLIGCIYLIGSALFLFFFDNQFNIFELNQANLLSFFELSPYFLLILLPALTMRSFAEEKENGTYDWLKTMPIYSYKIIFSKFLSILIGLIFLVILSLTNYYIVNYFSLDNLDGGLLLSSYFGLILYGFFLISIGVYCSIMSKNQITAYILTVLIGIFFHFFFDGLADYNLIGNFDFIIKLFSSNFHYERFSQGLFYISSFVYFFGLSFIFLILTHLKLVK